MLLDSWAGRARDVSEGDKVGFGDLVDSSRYLRAIPHVLLPQGSLNFEDACMKTTTKGHAYLFTD